MNLIIFVSVVALGIGVWYIAVYFAVSLLNYLTRPLK